MPKELIEFKAGDWVVWRGRWSPEYAEVTRVALGFKRIGTYILASEPGTSLTAAGWRLIGETKGGSWSRPSRGRTDKHPLQQKLLFERAIAE